MDWMQEFTLPFVMGQLEAYCYMVERGKPCADMIISADQIQEVIAYIKNETNLYYYLEQIDGNDYVLYIYKHAFMHDVLQNKPKNPSSIFDFWIYGKIFGYSDEAISDFLTRRCGYNPSPRG